MNNKNNIVDQAQGAVPTKEQIEKWLAQDLSRAISCLHAIQSDPDILSAVADLMLGRLENERNRVAQQQPQPVE